MCTNRVRTSLIYDVINRLSSLHSFTCDSWLKRCDSKIKPNKWRENKPPFVLFFIILIMHLLSIFSARRLSPRVLQRHHCWKMWAYHVLLHEAVVLSDAWWVFCFFFFFLSCRLPVCCGLQTLLVPPVFHRHSFIPRSHWTGSSSIQLWWDDHNICTVVLTLLTVTTPSFIFIRSFLKRRLLGSRSVNTENAV